MKITVFTSDNIRHKYLINLLSRSCDQLMAIVETKINSNNKIIKEESELSKKYFDFVNKAQAKLFGDIKTDDKKKNVEILSMSYGNLSDYNFKNNLKFLSSDIYIVFGSSYIKGDLVNFLIDKNAINIHAGVSPYYRGADCNFWALFDGNPHLVGSTIHYLSKGLDDGSILYHAMSKEKNDPFEYTMSTVKSAFHSIVDRIKDKSLLKLKPLKQNKSNEIRYSKKVEFNDKIINEYFSKNIDLNCKNFDNSLLKDPYFFNN